MWDDVGHVNNAVGWSDILYLNASLGFSKAIALDKLTLAHEIIKSLPIMCIR